MKLLRESFAQINTHFHLVGLYTIADLIARMIIAWVADEPGGAGVVLLALVLQGGVEYGILGVLFHHAAGRPGRPSLPRYALTLFPPLFWLELKLSVLTIGPGYLAASTLRSLRAPGTPVEEPPTVELFWIFPVVNLFLLLLSLYSLPLCVVGKVSNQRTLPIRQGVRMLLNSRGASLLLPALVMFNALLTGAFHYAAGPEAATAAPDIPDGLLLLVSSYLSLVAYFGATRTVIALVRNPASGAISEGGP